MKQKQKQDNNIVFLTLILVPQNKIETKKTNYNQEMEQFLFSIY